MNKPSERGKGVGFSWRKVPVERAADVMLEEHGAEALKQVRLGKAAGRRARSRKIYQNLAKSPGVQAGDG